MYVCVYVYVYVCVCIYVCIYVCVFIHNPIFCPAHGMVCPHLQCRCDCSNCFINSTMGVDITTYRQRIGTFHGSRYVCGQSKLCLVNFLYSVFFAASGSSCVLARLGVILLLIVCMHLVMYMMSFEVYISFREPRGVYPDNTKPFPFSDCSTLNPNFFASFSSCLLILLRLSKKLYANYSLKDMIYCMTMLNLMLIVICNPNILNPGPNKTNHINVCYANVQGFIPFTQLKDRHPELYKLKVLELNTYLSSEMPAIIVLNETWLKKSIVDNEIIFNKTYKIFRRDIPKKVSLIREERLSHMYKVTT